MIFLNLQFLENIFRLKLKKKYFSRNQAKFFFDWKVFDVDRKVFSVDQFF
jgi:hypothetical protein